jgi:hypothetical protein
VNYGPRSNFLYIAIPFTFTRTIYILAYYYLLPLDTLNPLFTANRWDWQPHHKLGIKFLVVLCAGSMLLLVQSKVLDEAPYKLSGAVAKLASITFWSLAFSYWFDKPWFYNWGKLAAVLIIPSSWGYQLGALTLHHQLTMTRTCLGPKSSSMRFGNSYFKGHEIFNLWFVKHMCFIILLALTLIIQEAYDGGNESSKLISIIIFGGL